jgi:hypothetical protein
MFSAIRSRITYVNVVATLVLVFAMTGGAYAAKKYLITSTKQISPSVLKSLQGKAGVAGANGAQGPAGPQGAAGKDGSNGKDGAPGAKGGSGAGGKSVVASSVGAGEEGCAEGGTSFEVEGSGVKHQACNGEAGAPGAAGSPWVVGEAPSGAVLKGTWVLPSATATGENEEFFTAISSGVPIPTPSVEAGGIAVINAPFGTLCPEGSPEEPKPGLPGVLCVFVAEKANVGPPNSANSKLKLSHGGIVMEFNSSGAGVVSAYGSWAYKVP